MTAREGARVPLADVAFRSARHAAKSQWTSIQAPHPSPRPQRSATETFITPTSDQATYVVLVQGSW